MIPPGIRYVVHGENALGYIHERTPWLMGVLAGCVWSGGPDPKNGPIAVSAPTRPATMADFDRFRVIPPPDLFPPVHPLDLGGCVIGLQEQPDGSIRIVP